MTNRTAAIYERACAELAAAQLAFDTIMDANEPLVAHLEAMNKQMEEVGIALAMDVATVHDYEEAVEAVRNAEMAIEDVSGDAKNIWNGARQRAYKAYEDYIA
jgi:hypothetical protein